MKTETRIANRTMRLLKSLGSYRKLHILYACCALSGPMILIFAYRPLMIKLHDAANRVQKMETKLLNQRSAIAALDDSNTKGEMIRQNDLSLAIAELTEKGRSLGLRFTSIAQQRLQETAQAGIQKLPISFTIESEYKNVGQFLSYIEGFPRSIAEVESLSIRPRENDLPKLSVKLLLNLYVEIEDAAQ